MGGITTGTSLTSSITLEVLYEVKFWLNRAEKRGLIDSEKYAKFTEDLDQLLLKLNAYIKSKRKSLEK